MLATLISENRIFGTRLPEKISGKYWLSDEMHDDCEKLISFEASTDGRDWIIPEQETLWLKTENGNYERTELRLEAGSLYYLKHAKAGVAVLFTEPFTENRRIFRKYFVKDGMTVQIGREADNDIMIDNKYVGTHHASVEYRNGMWTLSDHHSSNGTYLNEKRVSGKETLHVGDVIWIFGFRCVIGCNFLSFNNPDDCVMVHGEKLEAFKVEKMETREQAISLAEDYYYRSPRFRKEITPLHLKVDLPTRREDRDEQPLILTIGPALVMGSASFSVGIISMITAINEGRSLLTTLPTMMTAVAMLAGMIVFPFLVRRRDKRRRAEREVERREKYLSYLQRLRVEIEKNQTKQRDYLRANYPEIISYTETTDFWERHLWEKSKGQSDFLEMRIGIGNMPMLAQIEFPENRFSIEDDVMREELLAFQNEERLLIDVPITLSLGRHRIVGIVGNKAGQLRILYNILLQIFLLHSYSEVKLIYIGSEEDMKTLPFLRYAKHIWDDEEKQRYLALNEDNLRELSIVINKLLAGYREQKQQEHGSDGSTHYVIISTNKKLSNQCDFLQEIMNDSLYTDFSVLCIYPTVKNLPKECETVIEVNEKQGIITGGQSGLIGQTSFALDTICMEDVESLTGCMSAYNIDLNAGRYELPESLSFMEMLGIGKCEYLNILQRWENHYPSKSLQAPVGVDALGSVLYLDLHERFHGPHGLIAGMTGSGKSEFVITYVLSMAINYHPDEVSFVLIDYKGGGLAGAFENEHYRLPHLAGTITNLDGDSVMRSILSIQSELRRRQRILNEARIIANEGTMDIYKYQKMYRDGQVREAMPHLFIIADEFAELKAQQPEFMDQLISTARIGRSLGVHLILATQKPSGVVNDQIWANSRFKVCLKVQDRADSNDMLKRPEAAELKETGRFYLQIGYNESFDLGQSAWSGASYPDEEENTADLSIETIDVLGNVVDKIKPVQKERGMTSNTQIVKIMEYLDELAQAEHLKPRRLWLPEMPGVIVMDRLLEQYRYQKKDTGELVGVIGELDDPYRQDKRLLTINFTEKGNVLIYGAAGSGKEMMIEAVLYSLYEHYEPKELHAYILDFGSESLQVFRNAPQTGSVILDGETEEIRGFFGMLHKELRRRKKLFAESGGDYLRYRREVKDNVPYMLVCLHNYSHFYENYEQYDDLLVSLTRECPKYGIYFIITGTSASAVRYRLTQNFSQIYVMQLNDPSDYVTILGRTDGVYPSKYQGRGILKDDAVYVFQTASITEDRSRQMDYLRKTCISLREKCPDAAAIPVPVVPEFVSGKRIGERGISVEKVPLGIGFASYAPVVWNFKKRNILYAIALDSRELLAFSGGVQEVVSGIPNMDRVVVNGGKELSRVVNVSYEDISENYETAVRQIFEKAVERNNNYKETAGKPVVDMKPVMIVLQEYGKIKKTLSEDGQDKLKVLLTKTESFCNMFFVITDTYQASNAYSMEEWLTERCNGSGMWIGAGFEDQIRFSTMQRRHDRAGLEDRRTGYLVDRGEAIRLRYVMPEKLEEEMKNEE